MVLWSFLGLLQAPVKQEIVNTAAEELRLPHFLDLNGTNVQNESLSVKIAEIQTVQIQSKLFQKVAICFQPTKL